MHPKNIVESGKKVEEASKALIMLHGRGGAAEDILSLASYLNVNDFAFLAPRAANNSWYPLSFLAPPSDNEPWLSSALDLLSGMVDDLKGRGMASENIYLLGFSQGACLALEFAARNAARYGGIAAFTGGLIGDKIHAGNYKGSFAGTPVFIGSGDPDPHVPVGRVNATAEILERMGASVALRLYPGRAHTVGGDEIEQVNKLIFK